MNWRDRLRRSVLTPVVAIPLIAAVAWPLYGGGFVNYDAMWSLVWGDQIASLSQPSFEAPLAPTPHPLSNLVAVVLAPLGADAETALHLLGYLAVGALVYATGAVAHRLFGTAAAIVAALLVLSRNTLATYGAMAYLDVAFAALVVWAVALEAGERRRGWPVLALLAVAGLLRPEAWLIAAGYWAWLALTGDRRKALRLAPLVALAPLVWVLLDFVVTGEPLFSFTHTRSAAEEFGRVVGIGGLVEHGPRVLGQELRPAVLVAAALGFLLSAVFERSRFLLTWTLAIGAAFCVPIAAGTPLNARYLLPVIALACVAAAGGLTGWARQTGRPRRLWIGAAVFVAVLLVATAPAQLRRLDERRDQLSAVDARREAARAVVSPGVPCLPVAVGHPFLTPLVALWAQVDVRAVRPMPVGAEIVAGAVLTNTAQAVAGLAPPTPGPRAPEGARPVRTSGGWTLTARCANAR